MASNKKNYDVFLEKYLKEYQENPHSRIFAPLAESYRKSGLVDEAIEICKEGLQYHPNFISGRVALARAYFQKEMYKESIEELKKVISEAPDNYLAQKLLAEAYKITGNREESLKTYKILLHLNPRDDEVISIIDQMENEDLKVVLEEDLTDIEVNDEEKDFNYDDIIEESESEMHFQEKPLNIAFNIDTAEDKKDEVINKIKTPTVASLLEKQGHLEKALEVYNEIYKTNPSNTEIKAAIERLEQKIGLEKYENIEEPSYKIGTDPNDFEKIKEETKVILKDFTPEENTDHDDNWITPKKENTKVKKLKDILSRVKKYKLQSS